MIYVAGEDMFRFMPQYKEMGDRLRQARVDAGFASAEDAAAALGVKKSTYRAHENGQNRFNLDQAKVYAKRFNCDAVWLLSGVDAGIAMPITDSVVHYLPNANIRDRLPQVEGPKIPVYGQAVGGVNGEFIMNGSVLFEIMAPPSVSGVRGAYAVQITGDSMSPRYEDGEIAIVDPTRRVKRGDYVIVQIQMEEEGPLLGFVKKFISHNSEKLTLEQFNPPQQLTFPHHAVVSVHYIGLAGPDF